MAHDSPAPDEASPHHPVPEPEPAHEQAVQDALGDNPRRAELRAMQEALHQRRQVLGHDLERETDPERRAELEHHLQHLEESYAALEEEAAIAGFVEDSVRASIEMRRRLQE